MIADGITWFVGKVVEYMSEPYQSWDAFVNAATLGIRMFFQLESRFSWIYFVASFLIGIGVYAFERRKRNLGDGVSLARFIFPREVWGHPSAIVDYKFVAIDMTIKSLTYGPMFSGMTLLFYKAAFYVSQSTWLGFVSPIHPDPIMVAFVALLVGDFGVFFGHYLAHKVLLFWIFHQIHHSAEVLTPVTVYRAHPIDGLLSSVVISIVTALAAVSYTTMSGFPVGDLTILGVNAFTFLFYMAGAHLRHSHIWLSYGPIASWIFQSPAQHQIHHSKDPKHWDKNFGFMFSIWDALFGSLYIPREKESLQLGIAHANSEDFSTVSKLYALPVVKAARYILGKQEVTTVTIGEVSAKRD